MYCIGLMSGTSMDGIDAALIATNGDTDVKLIQARSVTYPNYFQTLLKAAEYAVHKYAGDVASVSDHFEDCLQEFLQHKLQLENVTDYISMLKTEFQIQFNQALNFNAVCNALDELHVQAVQSLLKKTELQATDISVIGYHGQTLLHDPQNNISYQAGDGQHLADALKIDVVYDFRSRDVALGGEGAPLAPLYHHALVNRDQLLPAVIINCGGIANITYINSDQPEAIIGFDTGPGNALLDRFVKIKTQGKLQMDVNGVFSKAGTPRPEIITILKEHSGLKEYMAKQPPKSLDANDFNLPPQLLASDFSNEDICASLVEFSTLLIADSIEQYASAAKQVILVGGGWRNPSILKSLTDKVAPRQVLFADDLQWDNDSIEAQCFAYLAARHLQNKPTTYPNMTNVSEPVCGGRLVKSCNSL